MKKFSSKEFFVVLSLLPALVLCTEGLPGPVQDLGHHERYFVNSSEEQDVGVSQQVQPEEVTEIATTEGVTKIASTEKVTQIATTEEVTKIASTEEVTQITATEAVTKIATAEEVTQITATEEVSEISTTEEVTQITATEAVTQIAATEEITHIATTKEVTQIAATEAVTQFPLEVENLVLDDSLSSNKVTEDPKKNVNTPGYGTEWALTYQSLQQESATINNTVSNVTAQVGGTAFLPCRVGHLGDRQISWIRKRDWHVLTSADVLYTHDRRFSVLHTAGSQDWTLQIKVVTLKDNGTYECQVSTGTGIISLFVDLEVVTPEAQIPGHGQYHVNIGSPITLNCLIKQSPSPPQYVSWYHNGDLLNYDRERPEVKISTEVIGEEGMSSPTSNSTLVVENARDEHSGNYTCSAPNTIPASTMVFITEGDKTAAVQRIDPISVGCPLVPCDSIFLTLLVASSLGYHYLFTGR